MADVTKYKKTAMGYVINEDDLLIEALVRGTEYEQYIDEPDELIWKNIYPYLRLDGTEESATCNLLFEVNEYEYKQSKTIYKDMELVIIVLCHTSLMKFTDGTRIDYISGRLDRLFNKNPKFGSGKLSLKSNVASVLQGGKYHYRTMVYETKNRNNITC